MMLERLQKIIARSGLYSRRQAEELIRQGKVFVNGKKITELGFKADPTCSTIAVLGKKINLRSPRKYVLFHKPRQVMVTRDDPEGRKTIYDFLPGSLKILKPVGRLDYHSEGLLLLTNDGALAYQLTHPRHEIRKVYEVKVLGKVSPRQLDRLRQGILLDGFRTKPAEVAIVNENPKSTWLKMVLYEGRNRQIRRMCDKVNLTIKTLVRTEFGPYRLSGISLGKWKKVIPIYFRG